MGIMDLSTSTKIKEAISNVIMDRNPKESALDATVKFIVDNFEPKKDKDESGTSSKK